MTALCDRCFENVALDNGLTEWWEFPLRPWPGSTCDTCGEAEAKHATLVPDFTGIHSTDPKQEAAWTHTE